MTKQKLTLADTDKLFATHTSDNMRDRVLAFIIEYQAKHTGNTPNIDVIARHLETVPQAVRAMLGRLELGRKIHIVSRNPLRVVVMERDTLLPHEQADNAKPADPERFSRLLEADGTRHGLARWIAHHNKEYGRGPSLREAMTHLNLSNGSWVNRQLEILAERGLIQYAPGKNTELTDAGKSFYGMATPQRVVVPFTPKEKTMPRSAENELTYNQKIELRSHSGAAAQYAENIGRYIYGFQLNNFGASPTHEQLRAVIGHSGGGGVAAALLLLEREGLIKPRRKAEKRNVFLTEKGKERFAQQPVDYSEPDAAPEKPEVEEFGTGYDKPEPWNTGGTTEALPMEGWATEPAPPSAETVKAMLQGLATGDLIMELIERGYAVRK